MYVTRITSKMLKNAIFLYLYHAYLAYEFFWFSSNRKRSRKTNLWKLIKVLKKSFRSDFCPFLRKWCCYSCLLSQVLYIYDAMQFCETVKNITRFSPSIYHYNRMCTRSEQFLRPLPMGYIWQTSRGYWLMWKN